MTMQAMMFKSVNLLLSDRDTVVLNGLLAEPGHEPFNVSMSSILETDEKGRITFFMPNSTIKWSLVFFIQNLMIRQRLFEMDAFLDSRTNK